MSYDRQRIDRQILTINLDEANPFFTLYEKCKLGRPAKNVFFEWEVPDQTVLCSEHHSGFCACLVPVVEVHEYWPGGADNPFVSFDDHGGDWT